MPRQSGMLCREGVYYFNMRVPKDLRSLYREEFIRRSLRTSDYHEAVREARYRAFATDAEFAEKRRKLQAEKNGSERAKLRELSQREALNLVSRYLVDLEKTSEKWWEEEGDKFDAEDREISLDNLRIDETVYRGGNEHHRGEDGSADLDIFLKAEGLHCEKDSPAYQKLRPLFRLARLENIKRTIDRVSFNGAQSHQPIFRDVFAHRHIASSISVGEIVARRRQAILDAKHTPGTLKTYDVPARLLCEVLGKNTRLDEISKDDAEKLLKLLRRTPSNATKIYRGKTLVEAIEAADREGNQHRLSPKTLENYYNNISSIFNFAVEKKLIGENPFKDRYLRKAFAGENDETQKVHFSTDELNRLFRAPLYAGCENDGAGCTKAGQNHPRRGRFWIPLLSLFHGLRCNEAAQLYTEDIGEEEGIPYIFIRATRADGSKCDKHLKTRQSKRRVPIHPELVKMGFLDFVASRRADVDQPRLFPDLPSSPTGYFSNPFSKWFGRFKASMLGADCKATFHSFRHHFRTALGNAGIPLGDVEMLGGWESDSRSSEKQYDRATLTRLHSRIRAVKYPGLDLSHLYRKTHRRGRKSN